MRRFSPNLSNYKTFIASITRNMNRVMEKANFKCAQFRWSSSSLTHHLSFVPISSRLSLAFPGFKQDLFFFREQSSKILSYALMFSGPDFPHI